MTTCLRALALLTWAAAATSASAAEIPAKIGKTSSLNLNCASVKYPDYQQFLSINFGDQTVNDEAVSSLKMNSTSVSWFRLRMHPDFPNDLSKAEIAKHLVNRFSGHYAVSINAAPQPWDAQLPPPSLRCSMVGKRKF